jgi:hypothetical protein
VGLLGTTATQWKNDTVNNMLPFFKMQLFRASLPGDLRKAVAQHNQTTIMLDDMYQVATDAQRESVSAIQDDSQSEDEDDEEVEDEVAAFQNKRNNRFQGKNQNQPHGSGQRSNRYNPGSGNNQNRKYCFYCKIKNHTQEECQKRIKDNKPCKDKQG